MFEERISEYIDFIYECLMIVKINSSTPLRVGPHMTLYYW